MRKKTILSMAIASFSLSSIAGTMGSVTKINDLGYHAVAAVFGGSAWTKGNRYSSYTVLDDETFIYSPSGHSSALGFAGGFLGFERLLFSDNFFGQLGIEYDYFANNPIHGSSLAGVQVNTSTAYQYQYRFSSQQVLAAGKFFLVYAIPKFTGHTLHPYVSAALGTAFNKSTQFSTSTQQDGSINLTPIFANASNNNFSYNLGLGIEVDLQEHIRFGVGYRYSNLGKSNLGTGTIVYGPYTYPAGFALGNNYAYNQLLFQLTYVL